MSTEHETKEPYNPPQIFPGRMRKLGGRIGFEETRSSKVQRCHTIKCLQPNIRFCKIESKNPANHLKQGTHLRLFCAGCIQPCGVIASAGVKPCDFMCHGGTSTTCNTTCPMHWRHKLCGGEGCGVSHTGNGKFCPRCVCKVSGCEQLGPNYCNDHGCRNRGNTIRLGSASGSRCCNAHCNECGKRAMPGVHSRRCVAHACAQCGNRLIVGKPVGGAKLERKTIVLSVPSDFGSNEQIETKKKMHFAELTTLQNTRMLDHGIEMQFCVDCFAKYAPPVESMFGRLYN